MISQILKMLGSKAPNNDANGLFRATHSHNPTRYSHIMVLTPHFYAHIGAGLKVILPPVCKHTCFQTFWPWHHEYRLSQYLLKKFFRVTISYVKVTFISISYNEYIGSLMEQGEIKRNSRKIWLFWKVLYLVMFPKRGFSNNSL